MALMTGRLTVLVILSACLRAEGTDTVKTPGVSHYEGSLGQARYVIEVPSDWNGGLVLFLHGFRVDPVPRAEPPAINRYFLDRGYAWAASSFSGPGFIPDITASDTVALYDEFSRRFGTPSYAYVLGESMGGAAATISAERYEDRYDGALVMCGSVGASEFWGIYADFFTIGAQVAGIPAGTIDSMSAQAVIRDEIRPALERPSVRKDFDRLAVALTGGMRPLASEGLAKDHRSRWDTIEYLAGRGLLDNTDRDYAHAGVAPSSLLLVRGGKDAEGFYNTGDATGAISIPTLSVHDVADPIVTLAEPIRLRRLAVQQGREDLLVQRTVLSSTHCDFTDLERQQSFDALVDWVEQGIRPDGEDLLEFDPTALGHTFSDPARLSGLE